MPFGLPIPKQPTGPVTHWNLHDPIGVQAGYYLQIVDEHGDLASGTVMGGISPTYSWMLPPQSVQIHRSIRAEVMKDLGGGISVVSGGEGIGRISISGTYGVGPQKDPTLPSLGKNARDAMAQFFQNYLMANDALGAQGKPALQMVFAMVNGRWSEPQNEAYFVWPESFPTDARSVGHPYAWDWQASLMLLGVRTLPGPFDYSSLPSPAQLIRSPLQKLILALQGAYKQYTSVVNQLKHLQQQLNGIVTAIQGFVAGVENQIFQITSLVQGTAQSLQALKNTLNMQNFSAAMTQDISLMVYSTRVFLGQASMVADSYNQSGTTSSSMTPGQTVSPSRPTAIGLAHGDTLAALANIHLGDSSRWADLVRVNNLDFPYLDFSGPNGQPDPSYEGLNVLGNGSILKLPLPAVPGVVAIANDPIGTDLPDIPTAANILHGGNLNLAAAAIRRIVTPMGRIPWQPLYGSRIMKRVGQAQSLPLVVSLQNEVISTLKFDKRILSVGIVNVQLPSGGVIISTNLVSPLGVVPIAAPIQR